MGTEGSMDHQPGLELEHKASGTYQKGNTSSSTHQKTRQSQTPLWESVLILKMDLDWFPIASKAYGGLLVKTPPNMETGNA